MVSMGGCPLVQFRDHEYWYLPPERRLQRLIAALREASPFLEVRQRAHVVLVVDLLFLLTVSCSERVVR